jgi:hypothetical protein
MGFRLGSRKPVLLGREDWILLSLAAAKRSLHPVQLQKLLFLLGRQFPKLTAEPFYAFRSVSPGQLSEELKRDVNLLAMLGLLAIDVTDSGEREYRPTPQGLERALDLESRADPEATGFLRRMAAWVRTRSVDQLLHGPAEPTPAAPLPLPKPPPLRRR